ncbi:hypothetical protein DFAR_3180006 [Desulfarculales bacterium]
MSRLIVHAEFYLSEGLATYLQALRQDLLKWGLPRKLYFGNSPTCRLPPPGRDHRLPGHCSDPLTLQGRGKIERSFRIVRYPLLPGFRGDTLRDINEALACWIRDVYHQRKHLGTGQAPLQRFTSRMECIRPAHADPEGYFRNRATRRVALDRIVSLAGRLYEAPVPLIGKQIILLYHDHNPDRVEVLLENRPHGLLRPLDLAVNCRVKRDHHLLRLESSSTTAPTGGSLFLQKSGPEVSNS